MRLWGCIPMPSFVDVISAEFMASYHKLLGVPNGMQSKLQEDRHFPPSFIDLHNAPGEALCLPAHEAQGQQHAGDRSRQ